MVSDYLVKEYIKNQKDLSPNTIFINSEELINAYICEQLYLYSEKYQWQILNYVFEKIDTLDSQSKIQIYIDNAQKYYFECIYNNPRYEYKPNIIVKIERKSSLIFNYICKYYETLLSHMRIKNEYMDIDKSFYTVSTNPTYTDMVEDCAEFALHKDIDKINIRSSLKYIDGYMTQCIDEAEIDMNFLWSNEKIRKVSNRFALKYGINTNILNLGDLLC